jgi:predicted phosphoribosyltransferase
VAYEIAQALDLPLDVMLVRKLGVPGHEELAMGAIASGGVRVMNDEIVHSLGISQTAIDEVVAREEHELLRREKLYRGDRQPLVLRNKPVILVDDGAATGANMLAAIRAVRRLGASTITVALPVAPFTTHEMLAGVSDEMVTAEIGDPFYGVGAFYEDFSQTSDDEVRKLMRGAVLAIAEGKPQP